MRRRPKTKRRKSSFTRSCLRCQKEGELAPSELAKSRFEAKVNTGMLPSHTKFESYDWLICCGAVWPAPKVTS